MTTPKVTTVDVGGFRHYKVPGDERLYPSVTSVLGVLDKPAIPRWAAREAARYALEHADELSRLDFDQALRRASGAPWAERDRAADKGTDTHGVMEAIALGRPIDVIQPGTENAVRGVVEFWLEFKPVPIAVEQTVVSDLGYAGSFDLIASLGSQTALIDLKTSKSAYPDTALQLAAYGNADRIIHPDGSTEPVPQIDAYYVLHCPHDKPWGLVPYHVTEADFDAFLSTLAAFRWKRERSGEVMGRRTRKAVAA
jgi:hypothetical protein